MQIKSACVKIKNKMFSVVLIVWSIHPSALDSKMCPVKWLIAIVAR